MKPTWSGMPRALTHSQLQVLANHLVEVVDPETADQTLAEQLEADEARALQQTTSVAARVPTGSPATAGRCRTCSTTC